MSIATRIQSMEEHISDAYDSLSKFGVAAPSNKNIENIANLVNEIYDNTPKTDYVSGTNLTLENTRVGKIDFKDTDGIEKIGSGSTTQISYQGHNLINYTLATLKTLNTNGVWNNNQYTLNGLTFTINENLTISVSGTSTAKTELILEDMNYESGTTYTLWNGLTDNEYNKYSLFIGSYSTWGSNVFIGMNASASSIVLNSNATSTTIKPTSTATIKTNITIYNGNTLTNVLFKPIIYKGAYDSTKDFEPYTGGTASPNPDYPQDVNNVSGDNVIEISNKNLVEGLEFGEINSSTGAESSSTTILRTTNYIPYSKTDTYWQSLDGAKLSAGTNFRFYNKDKVYIGYATFGFNSGITNPTITKGSGVTTADLEPKYFRVRMQNTNVPSETSKYMVAKVSDLTYVAHQGNNYEINLSSKNLFDKDNSNLIMNDIYINPTGYVLRASNNMKTICMPCKPNTAYVVSKVSSARFVIGSATSNTAGTSMTTGRNNFTGTQLTLTTGANDKYLFVFYYNGSADTLSEETIRNSIQIEVGSTATSYTPYFNIELYKIENNQDYIYKTSGKNLFDSEKYLENASISNNTIVSANKNNLFYIPVQYGRNYTISFVDKGVSGNILYGFSNDKPVIGGACTYNLLDITQLNKHTFTPVSANNKYLCIRLNVVNTNQYLAMENIQVEVGDVATTYEPYGKDNWYWHKENYKIKLSSTNQTWIRTTTNTPDIARYRTDDYIDIIKKVSSSTIIGDILCNYYNPQIAGTAGSYGGNQGIAIDNLGAIFINDNTYSQDFAGWKEWLDSVDCYICFSLATPIETQITDETLIAQLNAWYNAQSMDDITYITVDGNLPMQLKLKALKK